MTVAELVALLDGVAPLDLAEGWDNVGLLVGRAGRQVELALAALELRAEVMQQAIDGGDFFAQFAATLLRELGLI